jgi:hypothetical protein
MHIEPPESPLRTFKEFLSHYAMIVLSIVTALALEQAALSWEHAREGARAKAEIEREIAENRTATREALERTRTNLKDWQGLLATAVAASAVPGAAPDKRLAVVAGAMSKFGDAIPPLKTTAWDAAIASHAVDYLDHADVARYSEVYASQHFFSTATWDVLRDGALRNLATLTLAQARGDIDANELVATMNWRVQTLTIIAADLGQLAQVLAPARDAH